METNPYQPPRASVADHAGAPPVSWSRATKVWWSLVWRLGLFSVLAGALVGGVAGAVLGAAGVPLRTIELVGNALGLLISIPIGIWVVRGVLGKSWSDFRIALVQRAS